MIVVDASAMLELLLDTPLGPAVARRVFKGRETLHAPHLLDVEVAQAVRRFVRSGELKAVRGLQAIEDLADLSLTRYPHYPFLSRIWELRHSMTAYDAAYVALAEALDAPLLTHDAALASASGHHAEIDLI